VPGEAAITVSFLEQILAVRIQAPRPGGPNPYPDLPANNKIDRLVWAKLKIMGIVPSPLCNDATFIRRLYLDTIGTLPTPDEIRGFLADKHADKRNRLIDKILKRDELDDYWALKWADILLVDQKKLGDRGAYEFHRWLREQFSRNRPYDEWVRELLTERWLSEKVVSRGRMHLADTLPGFIAWQGENRIGLVTYEIEEEECEIVTLDSLAEGLGIGTELLKSVLQAAVKAKCNRAWLVTTNDNINALRFYQTRGFLLAALHRNAIEESRKLKPEIPARGFDNIALRDEIEFEMVLR